MSNRRNNDIDAAAGCAFLIFGAIAFVGFWIWDLFQTPPKTKLIGHNPDSSWGTIIEATECSSCGNAQDSSHRACTFCGTSLYSLPNIPAKQRLFSSYSKPVRILIYVAIAITPIILCIATVIILEL